MNPLTLVKRIQSINSREATLGISEDASWHAKYKDSAYVFVGGIPFDLTEGDLLAVFAQYGEVVDVNLVRDKGTGKSKGFAFVAYEDQRSTNLAVDNLNGAQILGRIIRVDHVSKYKKKEEEDEEEELKKREARGVCRAFQKGECTRGAGCKFSHDELRAANTGWGADDKTSTWGHDKFEGKSKGVCRDFQKGVCHRGAGCKFSHDEQRAADTRWGADDKTSSLGHDKIEGQRKRDRGSGLSEHTPQEDPRSNDKNTRLHDEKLGRSSRAKSDDWGIESHNKQRTSNRLDEDNRGRERLSEWKEKGKDHDEDRNRRDNGKKLVRHEFEPTSIDDDRREATRSSRHKSEFYPREDRDKRGAERSSTLSRDYSSPRHQDEDYRRKSDR